MSPQMKPEPPPAPEPPPKRSRFESTDRAQLLAAMKDQVRALYEANHATDTLQIGETSISIADVAEDFFRARHQVYYFNKRNLPQLIASFRQQSFTDPDKTEQVPVLVEAAVAPTGDLTHPLGMLDGIAHLLRTTDVAHAKEALVSRTSEFLCTGSEGQPSGPNAGDYVLYAKGFFLSTQTVFGISTPARGYLPPGRYSFGIVDQGMPRFEDFLWEIPTRDAVRVMLP